MGEIVNNDKSMRYATKLLGTIPAHIRKHMYWE